MGHFLGHPVDVSGPNYTILRLRLHGIGYVKIRLESDPLWYVSTLFTWDRFENRTGTVHNGITFISGPIWYKMADPQGLSVPILYRFSTGSVPCKHCLNCFRNI